MQRLVIALTSLLAVAGAAVIAGYLFIFGAVGDRTARLAPADSVAYVTLYLSPSTGQRMNLGDLLVKLPGFGDRATIDTKVDELVQRLSASAGVDYRANLRPWLGDQLALAVGPAARGGAGVAAGNILLIAEVKDPADAREGLLRLAGTAGECAGQGKSTDYHGVALIATCGPQALTFAFIDDTLLAANLPGRVRAAIDVAQGRADSLADKDSFRAAIRALPSDYLAAAYVDLGAAARQSGLSLPSGYSGAGVALVAEPGGLHIVGRVPFDASVADASARTGLALSSEPSSLPDWMPAGTDAELVVFGAQRALASLEAQMSTIPGGQDAARTLTQLRGLAAIGLGVDIDADILPLFDREAGVAVQDLDGAAPHVELLLRPTNVDQASATLQRIADRLRARGSSVTTSSDPVPITTVSIPQVGDLAYAVTDGVIVLAQGAGDVRAVLDAHTAGTSVAREAAYRSTFELAGARGGNELYLDAATLLETLSTAGVIGELPSDVRDILTHVGAIGLTMPSHDDSIEFHATLTVH